MRAIKYQSGELINGLEFITDAKGHRNKCIRRKALFKCNCGRQFEAFIANVRTGNTESCGWCSALDARTKACTKHGFRHHNLYGIWTGIKTRCYNKNRDEYKWYGKRGICLSDEFHDFKIWFDYVTSLPRYKERVVLGLTLDRINNNGNYERGNLRWATLSEQNLNRRSKQACKITNNINHHGEPVNSKIIIQPGRC